MATVLLVRHGRTTANATGLLAGRTPGVSLDDHGREQAARTGDRIAAVPVAAVVATDAACASSTFTAGSRVSKRSCVSSMTPDAAPTLR